MRNATRIRVTVTMSEYTKERNKAWTYTMEHLRDGYFSFTSNEVFALLVKYQEVNHIIIQTPSTYEANYISGGWTINHPTRVYDTLRSMTKRDILVRYRNVTKGRGSQCKYRYEFAQ